MLHASRDKSPLSNNTIKVSDPLLNGWKLCYAPDTPCLNFLKDKVLEYSPNLNNSNRKSPSPINSQREVTYSPILQEDVPSSPSKRQRSESSNDLEEHAQEVVISSIDNRSQTPSASEQPKKSRRMLPKMIPAGKSTMISTARFASTSRMNKITSYINSNRRELPISKTGSRQTQTPPINNKRVTDLYNELSDEQKMVYNYIFEENKNVFYSGSAGTGKTVLLRAIISKLQSVYSSNEIAITASTGVAAVNIQGVTIHSFARVGLGDKSVQHYIERYKKNRSYTSSLCKIRVLIVDEISMLDGELLDKIEAVCRGVRMNQNKPFGGIQVIFCGDFFQLPPVNKEKLCRMAFEANCWNRVIEKVFLLKTPFRQKDPEFIQVLNEIRYGCLSPKSEQILKSLSREPHLGSGIEPTELYSLVREVERSNSNKLAQLPGEEYTYTAIDYMESSYYQYELDNLRAPTTLKLKENAQVMLTKNLTPTLVNGSVGKVIGFQKEDNCACPIVQFSNGEQRVMKREEWSTVKAGRKVATRQQIPLILAYAISIHKSQGQTIEFVKVNLNNTFEQGQVYVALSRATRMETLQVLNFKKSAIKVNQKVVNFYNEFISK